MIDVLNVLKSSFHRNRQQSARSKTSHNSFREVNTWVPPGHFYSPIPDVEDIRRRCTRVFNRNVETIPGVDMNAKGQELLLKRIARFYSEIPFKGRKQKGLRYYFDNEFYGYFDGTMLYCMLRYLRPRRYVEIGSGYSSCLALDTNRLNLKGRMELTFIEPYPAIFNSLLNEEEAKVLLVEKKLQDVDNEIFSDLRSGDVLFVDSTHVTRTDSDVNHILFEILPRLSPGVYIHFHDIFYPFEYPEEWVYEGRAWNEDYILRAFLQFNSEFEIMLFNSYVSHFYRSFITQNMPLALKGGGLSQTFVGGGFWLRKKVS